MLVRGRILVADDDAAVVQALTLLLQSEGYEVVAITSPKEIATVGQTQRVGLAIVDLNYARGMTSGQEGLEFLERLRSADPSLPVLVMTAWGNGKAEARARQRGAREFFEKPWDDEQLLRAIARHVDVSRTDRSHDT